MFKENGGGGGGSGGETLAAAFSVLGPESATGIPGAITGAAKGELPGDAAQVQNGSASHGETPTGDADQARAEEASADSPESV